MERRCSRYPLSLSLCLSVSLSLSPSLSLSLSPLSLPLVSPSTRLSQLHDLLHALLANAPGMPSVTDAELSQIIDQTFLSADSNDDGKISLEEYAAMCHADPSILHHFTIASDDLLNG